MTSAADNFYIEDQMARIERTLARLEGCDSVSDDTHHALRDAFIDFNIHCYHLKDVLIQTKTFDRKLVEDYISTSFYLSSCANIANKAKHLKFNRPQREPALPNLAGEHLPIGMFCNPFTKKSELKILHGSH